MTSEHSTDAANSTTCRRYLVEGRVQGVCFRAATRERARELGLSGWVRNLPDGRVEAAAEGDPSALRAFEAFLHRGPPPAAVETVATEALDDGGGWHDFEVR